MTPAAWIIIGAVIVAIGSLVAAIGGIRSSNDTTQQINEINELIEANNELRSFDAERQEARDLALLNKETQPEKAEKEVIELRTRRLMESLQDAQKPGADTKTVIAKTRTYLKENEAIRQDKINSQHSADAQKRVQINKIWQPILPIVAEIFLRELEPYVDEGIFKTVEKRDWNDSQKRDELGRTYHIVLATTPTGVEVCITHTANFVVISVDDVVRASIVSYSDHGSNISINVHSQPENKPHTITSFDRLDIDKPGTRAELIEALTDRAHQAIPQILILAGVQPE